MRNVQTDVEALSAAKRGWYDHACTSGVLSSIAMVCRSHGSRVDARYGPKYELVVNGVDVYVDDYGGYMTVHRTSDRQLLCSTHPCERLFAPGEWTQPLLELLPHAEAQIAAEATAALKRERDALVRELGL